MKDLESWEEAKNSAIKNQPILQKLIDMKTSDRDNDFKLNRKLRDMMR